MHGSQPTPARFFDADGNEVNAKGERKPEGVPTEARPDANGQWVINQNVLQDAYDGVEKAWRSDGRPLFEQHHEGDRLVLVRQFHPDGTQAEERDYRAGKGWFRRAEGETDVEGPEMPGDALEVRYAMQVVNPKTGLYWSRDQVYLDADGLELSGRGLTIRKPHPDAHLVTDGSWYQPQTYWCHTQDGETSYWRQEGTLVMKARHEGEFLVGFVRYNDDGEPVIEETFFPRVEDERRRGLGRPINRAITVHVEGGRVEIACNDDGSCRTFTCYQGDTVVDTIDNASLESLEIGGFEAEFARRFERIQAVSGVEVWYGFFTFAAVGVETFDDVFAAAVLGGDGGGNEIVAVLEGKHAGEVYFLDHEEGLYALECVDEFIDEEGLDVASMSKDALIEAMPFMENPLAPNLAAFVRNIRVNAHTTYYRGLKDFKPVAT